jgi:cytochrome c2
VDVIRTRERFPRMMPPAGAPDSVRAGFEAFRVHCCRCHTLNGEGGRIGPELNPGVGPVEVRGRYWLRRWIDDPSQLVPNARMERLDPELPDRDRIIDEILAYLQAMADARPEPSAPEAAGGS